MAETQRPGEAGAQEDVRALLHRLNNQLGVILAHAELIEAKAADEAQRARANQVVSAALEAMAIARELRSSAASPTS
jgi:hypothetical protein